MQDAIISFDSVKLYSRDDLGFVTSGLVSVCRAIIFQLHLQLVAETRTV